jgi:hypothetical protein
MALEDLQLRLLLSVLALMWNFVGATTLPEMTKGLSMPKS